MSDDTKQLACSDCIYWSASRRPSASNGQCRRFPPTTQRSDRGLMSMWPLTEAYGWCGEHTVIETEPT
ncbi:hypothetical protein [Thalassobaculum sp.]|uniref:hypothetical protein n=1 Tax=Thalassobaculum sp. TaxID=2022740 RepID=UPI0032EFF430